jgi:phage shock protein A
MGKMFDNMRAKWNDISDKMSDPGKLAQLSVSDLEKAIAKSKEAAAPVIGSPVIMQKKLDELKKTDELLTTKIKALISSGEEGKVAATKHIERQVEVRNSIAIAESDYLDAQETATAWQEKIRSLENELFSRRKAANSLEAKYATAKAEQNLGKHMQNIDSLTGSTSFDNLEAKVNKEQAKAAGYSKLSGLDDRLNEEKILKDVETQALLDEYMNNN